MWRRFKNNLRRFNDDEDGLETLQIVMIIAIAAIIMITLKYYWEAIKEWFSDMMNKATTGWDIQENKPDDVGD